MTVKEKQTSFGDRLDVLDFIIKILLEHEKTLDALIGQLEMLCQELELKVNREKYVPMGVQTARDSE